MTLSRSSYSLPCLAPLELTEGMRYRSVPHSYVELIKGSSPYRYLIALSIVNGYKIHKAIPIDASREPDAEISMFEVRKAIFTCQTWLRAMESTWHHERNATSITCDTHASQSPSLLCDCFTQVLVTVEFGASASPFGPLSLAPSLDFRIRTKTHNHHQSSHQHPQRWQSRAARTSQNLLQKRRGPPSSTVQFVLPSPCSLPPELPLCPYCLSTNPPPTRLTLHS